MIVKESISFERGIDPKEAIFGILPGTLVTNDRRYNGTSIMIEAYLRTPTKEDLRRWDPKKEHAKDQFLTYEIGLLQDPVEDAYGKGKNMPSTFFPHGFSGFNIVFQSESLRKLTDEEKEIVLRGLTEKRFSKTVEDIYHGIEEYTGVKIRMPVNEAIEFERGKDPKEAMSIGRIFYAIEVMFFDSEPGAHGTPPGRSFGTLIHKYSKNPEKKILGYFKGYLPSAIKLEGKHGIFVSLEDLIDQGYQYIDFMGLRVKIGDDEKGKK